MIPPLHLVTDDAVLARPGFPRDAAAAVEAGGARVALHLRGPGTGGRRLHELALALLPAIRAAGAALLVNDRVDVALACGADGVQLRARALSPADARRLLGAGPLIGASVHDAAEAGRAVRDGADFLLVGTLYATPSHPGRAGTGVGLVSALAGRGRPVVGIGGITRERVREVRMAGAAGVAVLRGAWDAASVAEAVSGYLKAWSERDG